MAAPRKKKPGPGKTSRKKKPTGKSKPPAQAARELVPGVKDGPREGEILPPRGPAVDAKQFLLAIMNCDPVLLPEMGVYEAPTISMRIAAAQTLLPFTHKRQPVDVIHKQGGPSWVGTIQAAQDRVARLRRVPEEGDSGIEEAPEVPE